MGRIQRTKQKKSEQIKYFNKHLFSEILKIINSDPYTAKLEFEEYIMDYPLDYSAQTTYASVLIRLQEFELAEKIINEVEIKIKTDKKIKAFINKMNLDLTSIVFCRCALLCHQQRYQELYEYLKTTYYDKTKLKIDAVLQYCKAKLGILKMDRDTQTSYIVRQIIEYQEEDMLEHIKHHLSEAETDEEPGQAIFESNFPYNEIINEIKKYMTPEKRICLGLYDDMYVFKYDNCGKSKYKLVNYFKVICFEDTTQIITMYPASDCEKLPYVDLNHLKLQEEQPKIKVLSQREKFNRRYNLTK